MGWVFIADGIPQGSTADSYLRQQFEYDRQKDGARHACKILKSAMVGRTWYGAAHITSPSRDVVAALVVITSRRRGGFGYKNMDEGMGPNECQCPASILALLSPAEVIGGMAADWRKRCAAAASDKIARSNAPSSEIAADIDDRQEQ